MKHINLSNINYKGYDVSSFIIEKNKNEFEKKNITFEYYNGNFEQIQEADLLICKDVLQHLPNNLIEDFLKIITKFKFILIANDIVPNMKQNTNIELGGWRPLDLRLPPFLLKAEACYTILRENNPSILVLLIDNTLN